MKILLVGDQHGDYKYIRKVFLHAKKVEADIIVQLGDYGYGWKVRQFDEDGVVECSFAHHTSQLTKEFDIFFYWLDGNHENFDWLEAFQADFPDLLREDGTWEVAENVFYMPRGNMMIWDDLRFLVCGGGTSTDRNRCREFVEWWHQEEITEADVDRCEKAGKADILLTHDFPWEGNILDRHLDPFWGEWAQKQVIKSRHQVSRVLAACGAKTVFHGHLHIAYTEQVEVDGHNVQLYGLDCNGNAMDRVVYLLDTEEYKQE